MNQSTEPLTIKLVCIGDGAVGKTCILIKYTSGEFPTTYVPTVFDNYTVQTMVDNQLINLSLWDTAGQETYNRLRTLSYKDADIFLIVFSVVDKTSFDNVLNKWYPELNEGEEAQIPKIVVGNKIDLRNSDDSNYITKEEAEKVLTNQKCKYFECSALTQQGLKEIFEESAKIAYQAKMSRNAQLSSKPLQATEKDQELKEEQCCCIIS